MISRVPLVDLDSIWIAVKEGLPAILKTLQPLVPPDVPPDDEPPATPKIP